MKIIFPPRPASKIPPHQVSLYKGDKWLAQRKFNGDRTVFCLHNGEFNALTRHGVLHKRYKFSSNIIKQFQSLYIDPSQEYWLDGELLDAHTTNKNYKDKIVLYDVLQAGKYLLREKLTERYDLLANICGNPTELESGGIALQVTENIWLAESFHDNFAEEYARYIDRNEIEGLVLKLKSSSLNNFGQKEYLVPWLIRVRKESKNYTH